MRKPGPGDLDALDPLAEPVAAAPRRAARRSPAAAAQRRREQHRGVRRVVAEAGLLRALERRPPTAVAAAVAQLGGGGLDGGAELVQGSHGSKMVRLARQDLVRPVQLLEQHDARELVRERHRAEGEPLVGRASARCRTGRRSRSRRRGRPAGAPRASARTPPRRTRRPPGRAATRWLRSGIRRSTCSSSRTSTTSTRAWRGQHRLVVLHVVGERRPHAADGDHRVAHALRYYGRWPEERPRAAHQPPHRPRGDGGDVRELRERLALRLRVHDHVRARRPRGRGRARSPASSSPASTSRRASCAS